MMKGTKNVARTSRPGEPTMILQQPPQPVKSFLDRIACLFDQRHAELVEPLFLGELLAHGRRTATAWFRAGGISDDFRRAYTVLGTLGRSKVPVAAAVLFSDLRVSVRRIAFLTVMVQWPLKGGHHHGPRQVARSARRTTVASVDPTVAAQWAVCPGFLWPPRPRRAELLRLASAVATAAGPRPIRAGASRPGRGTGRCRQRRSCCGRRTPRARRSGF